MYPSTRLIHQRWQQAFVLFVAWILLCTEAFIVSSERKRPLCSSRQSPTTIGSSSRRASLGATTRHTDDENEVSSSFIATCVPGLSGVLAEELQSLGCTAVEPTGGAAVRFEADGPTVLECLLWARTPHKLMEFLAESPPILKTRQDIHQFVQDEIPVQRLLGNGQGGLLSLSVTTILNAPRQIPADINHSHYTALTVKNALCDTVRELRGDRPNVDLDNPDVPLVAVLRGTPSGAQLSLYRQLHSGGSLHKRGYRPSTIHKAALKESLAAGLLLQAGWEKSCRAAQSKGKSPPLLLDPMTGSGTLVLEGLLIAADLAPHLMRIKTSMGAEQAAMHQHPPVLRWKDYADLRQDVWPQLLREATERAKTGLAWLRDTADGTYPVYVNDMHTGALSLLDESLTITGFHGLVNINAGDCADWNPPIQDKSGTRQNWTIVCNPPWGVRLEDDVEASWEALGKFLKQTCPAGRTTAYILSGHAKATKRLGLRRSQSMPITVGTQDLRWLQYEIHGPSSDEEKNVSVLEREPRQYNEESVATERVFRSKPPKSSIRAEFPRRSKSTSRSNGVKKQTSTETRKQPKRKTVRVPTSDTNEWLID